MKVKGRLSGMWKEEGKWDKRAIQAVNMVQVCYICVWKPQ
jgi:hypothetical protein